MSNLTDFGLRGLKKGKWASDGGARGAGTLVARRLSDGGVQFYYRYSAAGRERVILPLGHWSGTGGPLSLKEARARAADLSRRYLAGERDLRGALDAEARERRREREAIRRAEEEKAARKSATLGALLNAYVGQLERDGKASARAVAASFKRHIFNPWPKLATKSAHDVALDDLLDVVALVAEQGKLNEARKLRSYLKAAFSAAVRARQDARSAPELRSLSISANPARDIATIDGASKPGDRALTVGELRYYWTRISGMRHPKGALLRFHLLTGAQRIAQLGRVTTEDFDRDTQSILLRDGKGRRKTPRVHAVPLIPEAESALREMVTDRVGDFLVSSTHGRSGVSTSLFRSCLEPVVDAMEEAGELEKGRFTAADLRRTVETRLAAAGVSMEVRAQLQSHGLGNVQSRHYDRHEYLEEKRAALMTLYSILDKRGASVTPIRRGGQR